MAEKKPTVSEIKASKAEAKKIAEKHFQEFVPVNRESLNTLALQLTEISRVLAKVSVTLAETSDNLIKVSREGLE